MSNKIKVEITAEYEDVASEADRLYIDKLIDTLLKHADFNTPGNVLEDSDDPVNYTVEVVKQELPRGSTL